MIEGTRDSQQPLDQADFVSRQAEELRERYREIADA